MKSIRLFLITVLVLSTVLLFWIGKQRYYDFHDYHASIARETITALSNQVTWFINERKRLVQLIGDEHLELLESIIANPDNTAMQNKFSHLLNRYLPNHYAFIVANADGHPYLTDFDGLVGGLCISDIQQFARAKNYQPRIHPGTNAYHFDVMATLKNEKQDILFISFHTNLLGEILRASETPGHVVLLVLPEQENLIEVTSRGARINTPRDDFRLQPDELGRVLFKTNVPGTQWVAMDLSAPDLIKNYMNSIILQHSAVFMVLLIMSLYFYNRISNEERLRTRAEKAKNEFISTVSHELRTPLTAIHGSLGLLANGKLGNIPEDVMKLLVIAHHNSEQLIYLVNDLLDFRKLEEGKLEYQFRDINLVTVIHDCIDQMKDFANKYHVEYKFEPSNPRVMVHADINRMKQILTNLLSNAAKYGNESGKIEVTLLEADDTATVSVTDHGIGIPDSFRDKIFDKFTQLDSSDSRHRGGTGLGLSIVKALVEAHNGTITFESIQGEGSTFSVTLPRMKDAH